jgi:hypothetical protein
MIEYLLPMFGFLIGTIASMIGIGGGVFIVPLLTLLYWFDPSQAVGTSLTSIIFTSIASTLNYSTQKRIYYKTSILLAITTVPGAYLGAYLTSIIEEKQLGLIFGFFLIFVALRMIANFNIFTKSGRKENQIFKSEAELFGYKMKLLSGIALGFFGGLVSGLLGIGGGSLLVPIMTLVMGIPIHFAVATSMFTMIFTSTSGVIKHYTLGNIYFDYALALALGTVFGAQLGAYYSKKISSKNLRRIFGIVLVIVSVRMILKFL